MNGDPTYRDEDVEQAKKELKRILIAYAIAIVLLATLAGLTWRC